MVPTGSVGLGLRRCGTVVAARSRSTVAATAEAHTAEVDPEWATAKPFSEIPGPKPLPIPKYGNFWRMIPGIGTYGHLQLVDFNKQLNKEFGPIVKVSGMGRPDMIMVFDPKDAQKIYRTESTWPHRSGIESMDYYRRFTRKDIFQGNLGVLTTQGEEWQKNRTALNQPMMKPMNVMKYHQPIQVITNEFVDRIKQLRDNNLEMPDDFLNEMNKWALESISCVALDTRLGCLDGELKPDSEAQIMINAVEEMFVLLYKLDFLPSLWQYYSTRNWRKFVKAMDKIVNTSVRHINIKLEEIKNRPAGESEGKSVLEILLMKEGGISLARTMAIDMMTAGVDTTSNTSGIAMYYISKNEEVQEKVFAEMKALLPHKDDDLKPDYLNNIPYLKACIKESQRITPIVTANARRSGRDLVIKGYRIPKGIDMILESGVMCHSKEHFPRPMEFIPERWLKTGDPDLSIKNTHPYVFLPFGFGPRMCIGRRFAELEMHTLLTKLFRNFKITYNHGDMEWRSQILITPSKPLKYKMEDRPS